MWLRSTDLLRSDCVKNCFFLGSRAGGPKGILLSAWARLQGTVLSRVRGFPHAKSHLVNQALQEFGPPRLSKASSGQE